MTSVEARVQAARRFAGVDIELSRFCMHTIEHAIRKGGPGSSPPGSPIFLISGSPGAGKTTLLKRLLAHEMGHRRRPAVLVHEQGEANVNALLLRNRPGSEPGFDLEVVRSTCTCCDVGPAISDRLRALLRRSRGPVFIEASGLAPPGQLVEAVRGLLAAGSVSPRAAHLPSVLAVLDADRLAGSRLLTRMQHEDIAGADALVLNKTDLVRGRDLDPLVARLRSVNADAPILTATYGRVSAPQLLRLRPAPRSPSAKASSSSRGQALVSATAQLHGPVVVPRLQRLLARSRHELVRVKGFIRMKGAPGVHEVQWVPDVLEIRPRPRLPNIRAELVIVACPQLDWERLATELDRCVDLDPADTVKEAAAV
jgi:G3E family GTPase